MRWVGHVVHMGERQNAHKILIEKSEGKRPRRRNMCKWEGWWAFVTTVMNLRVPSKARNF
jgi:hypothetical protein